MILSNRPNTLTTLLSLLHINFTNDYANKLYTEHPYKYSLWGLSMMLNTYKIKTIGIKLEDKSEITKLEPPFIAHVNHAFVVVNKITKDNVYYQWDDKVLKNGLIEFYDNWSGILLIPEKNSQSKEPDYSEHRITKYKNLILDFIGSFAFLLIAVRFFIINSIYKEFPLLISLFFNLLGFYVSYLLVFKQLNIQSKYADKICSLFKQSDCNNILESSAAKFMGIIGWSEVGWGYFSTNLCIILLMPSLYNSIAIINIIALPYTVWSIWYQKFRAKQWCPLCLSVQTILWCIFITNWYHGLFDFSKIEIKDLLFVCCIYIICIWGRHILNTSLFKEKKLETITQEMNSLKMKDCIFKAYLESQAHYPVDKSTSKILFGNERSPILITILTNPFCHPCAQMHEKIDKLLKYIENDVCIQYIFSSFGKELDYAGKFLISVYLQKGKQKASTIFNNWYKNGVHDAEKFCLSYNTMIDDDIEKEYSAHQIWRKTNKLSATPTVLINGYELPEDYRIEDLEYLNWEAYIK